MCAKAPWSWGRMYDLLRYVLSEGTKIETRRQLKTGHRIRSKRKVELETKQTNKNARPRTTTDARTGALENGLDPKHLRRRKRDLILRM